MKILSCNSNRPLAEAIATYLDVPLTKADVRRFADMEVFVEIGWPPQHRRAPAFASRLAGAAPRRPRR